MNRTGDMMKIRLLLLCFILSVAAGHAQPALPSFCEAFRPAELSGSHRSLTVKQSDIDRFLKSSGYGQNKRNTQEYWQVLSDRDGNPVCGGLSAADGGECRTIYSSDGLRRYRSCRIIHIEKETACRIDFRCAARIFGKAYDGRHFRAGQ